MFQKKKTLYNICLLEMTPLIELIIIYKSRIDSTSSLTMYILSNDILPFLRDDHHFQHRKLPNKSSNVDLFSTVFFRPHCWWVPSEKKGSTIFLFPCFVPISFMSQFAVNNRYISRQVRIRVFENDFSVIIWRVT